MGISPALAAALRVKTKREDLKGRERLSFGVFMTQLE
jgi:hypothetical protein